MNFRIFNIPVYIHPTFWLFAIFFTHLFSAPSIEKVVLVFVLFFSLLVHEMGHALMARSFGGNPIIVLQAFGGVAQYNNAGMSSKQQFLITLSGPLLESALIAISYTLLKWNLFDNYYINYLLHVTMHLNICWVAFNLIPVIPLDGGQMVFYLLEKKFGERGYRASLILGLVCVAIAAPLLFTSGWFFYAALLVIFGFQNFQLLQNASGPSFRTYHQGLEALKNDKVESGKKLLKKLLKSKDSNLKHSAIETLAKTYYEENEPEKAYELLSGADPDSLKETKPLLCKLALAHENYELVAKYSREIYDLEPIYEIALLNSKAFAHLNQPAHAGAWLETALKFPNAEPLENLLEEKLFDALRDQPTFKQYIDHATTTSKK